MAITIVAFAFVPGAASAATPMGTYTDWAFPGSGYYNMDFRIEPLTDPSPAPYFWSEQYWFVGGDGGYTGLQTSAATRPDGTKGKIAITSVWRAIAVQPAPGGSCNPFDNEGSGYSCRIAYDWVPHHIYRMRMWTTSSDATGTWWGSWVMDLTSGIEQQIGSIKVPKAWGWLDYYSVVFTEYWGPLTDCDQLVLAEAYFHTPKANNGTVTPGPANNHLATQGDCPGSSESVGSDGAIHTMGTSDVTAPSTPAGLRVTSRTTNSMSIAWDQSTDNWLVTGYQVYRDGVLMATPSLTEFTDTGLSPGTTYSYSVRAIDKAGNLSQASQAIEAATGWDAPSEPRNVSAEPGLSIGAATLSWEPPASQGSAALTGYRIYRGTEPGSETLLGEVPATKTTYTDWTEPAALTRYYYVVSAINPVEGGLSSEACTRPYPWVSALGCTI